MSSQQYLAIPAKQFKSVASGGRLLNVHDATTVYLDERNQVWDCPNGKEGPLHHDTSTAWIQTCEFARGVGGTRTTLRSHRWNKGFQWRVPDRPKRLLSDDELNYFDKHGWVVLNGLLSKGTIEQLIRETDVAERESEAQLEQMRGGKGFIARAGEITFTTHLVNRSPFIREFYQSNIFSDIGNDLIGSDVRLYWDQAVYKKPGVEKPFPWHQDNGYTFVDPQNYLTIWIGLDAANEQNGCMWLVPEVHKMGTIHHDLTDLGYACYADDPPDAVPVPTDPGAIIVLSSLTPHKTGWNRTNKTRRALVAQLVPDGAVAVTEDAWKNIHRTIADRPDRQFKILEGGRPCGND